MGLIKSLKEALKEVLGVKAYIRWQRIELEKLQILQGKTLAEANKHKKNIKGFEEVEFSVFSQVGDDGIIQHLINNIDIPNKIFIEFGVQTYVESNTRFLLMNNYWKGLVLDGSQEFIDFIKNDYYFYKYDLTATCKFLTADNINLTIEEAGIKGDIGLLHIDIDGMDYWLWKAITIVNPVIVIVEYNSCFGSARAITVPYNPEFERYSGHYSGIYFGASLKALIELGKEKGYTFVGCNSYGNDAYFVRNDKAQAFLEKNIQTGFIKTRSRQNKDEKGKFTFKSDYDMMQTYSELKVYNTITNQIEELNEKRR